MTSCKQDLLEGLALKPLGRKEEEADIPSSF